MNTKNNIGKQVKRVLESKSAQVKLGIDQHARDVVVSMQEDGSVPQRAQKMQADDLLALVRGLVGGGAGAAGNTRPSAGRRSSARCWGEATSPERVRASGGSMAIANDQ